jgi:hypothetical protein
MPEERGLFAGTPECAPTFVAQVCSRLAGKWCISDAWPIGSGGTLVAGCGAAVDARETSKHRSRVTSRVGSYSVVSNGGVSDNHVVRGVMAQGVAHGHRPSLSISGIELIGLMTLVGCHTTT